MSGPRGTRNWPRRGGSVLAVVLALVASAAIGYRVLAPAETVTPARGVLPAPPADVPLGVIGTLNAAPLIVADQVRIYAFHRRVWADQPVGAETRRTAHWSYRRWPAEVTGVVEAAGAVITHWSDDRLVALDAATGHVRWRADAPVTELRYAGRRTGAATVWDPPGLRTGTGADGEAVLVVLGRSEIRALDPRHGRELWRFAYAEDCRDAGLTTTDGHLLILDRCSGPQVVEFRDLITGALVDRWRPAGAGPTFEVVPVGCRIGRSDCPGVRTVGPESSRGWLVDAAGSPVSVASLAEPDAMLVGEVVVHPSGIGVLARHVRTGAQLWRHTGPEGYALLAVAPGRVQLRTSAGDLVTVDPATGAERSRFPLTFRGDSLTWAPGLVYAVGRYLAVERLAEPVEPTASDQRYYLAAQPVILAAT